MGSQQERFLMNLKGEFPGGRHNQGRRDAGLAIGQFEQAGEYRDQKRACFTRTGLRLPGDIFSLQGRRQDLGLNGGATVELRVLKTGQQALRQIETVKGCFGQKSGFVGALRWRRRVGCFGHNVLIGCGAFAHD
jgi:hypothetical protein